MIGFMEFTEEIPSTGLGSPDKMTDRKSTKILKSKFNEYTSFFNLVLAMLQLEKLCPLPSGSLVNLIMLEIKRTALLSTTMMILWLKVNGTIGLVPTKLELFANFHFHLLKLK